jgi:uncharacterized protein
MAEETQVSRRTKVIEIIFASLTGAGKIIFMDLLNWKLPFITVITIGWSYYVWHQFKKNPTTLFNWGFRVDNFKSVVKRILPFGVLAVLSFFIVGYQLKTINITWHILPILILYPIWGVIQQFLVISLVAGNLQDLKKGSWNEVVIILIAAVLFGLVHYPYNWLIVGTFVLAIFYGYIFLRERNVYVMGLFHGWLGALFFYTVVGRDPFIEVFGKYFS